MNEKRTKFFWIMVCATILMDLIPSLGFFTVGTISITTIHIPTILTAIFLGPLPGMALGSIFGLISLFHAFSREAAVLDVLFLNPLISVLPRLCIGLVSGYLFRLLQKKWGRHPTICAALSAAAGSLTNTVLVLFSLVLWAPKRMLEIYHLSSLGKLIPALLDIVKLNGSIEALVTTLFCALAAYCCFHIQSRSLTTPR